MFRIISAQPLGALIKTSAISLLLSSVFSLPAIAQQANTGIRQFDNDSVLSAITLRKRSNPSVEIQIGKGGSKKFNVTLGDVFDVVVDGPEQAPPVFINHLRTDYPVVIRPEKPYKDIDPRGQHVFMGRDLATAYFGFDLRTFNSRDIVSSTGSRRIFTGLQPQSTQYEILAGGYIPRGCGYGDRNTSEGKNSYEKIFTHDAFLKSWDIGVSGDIPLGAGPASLGLNFAYGETEVSNATNNSVFIVNHKKDVRYFVNCDPLDKAGNPNFTTATMTPDFVRGVQRVRDSASADAFVSTFGTHYAGEVNYGGHRTSWMTIQETDYYKGLEQKIDFAAEVKVAASTQKVAKTTPNSNPFEPTTTTTSTDQTSPGGSGALNFSHVEKQETRDILNKSESYFWAAGGEGALIDNWNVPADSAVPVSVNLRRIDKLIRPELFRSLLTEAELGPARRLIAQAVDSAIAQVPTIAKPEEKRGFRIRLRSVAFEEDVDDLSHEMKGDIAINLTGSQPVRKALWSSDDGWVDPRDQWRTPGPWFEYVQNGDAQGNYAALTLAISGELIDNDAGTGDTCLSILPHCDDPITFSTSALEQRIPLDKLDEMKNLTFEMKGFRTHAEKTTLKILVQVQPMTFFGNQLGSSNKRSAPVAMTTPATSAVWTNLPIEHDQRQAVLDPDFYINHYADLKSAFGNNVAAARKHWLEFGINEGRQSSAAFSVAAYVERYPDLKEAFGNDYAAALNHWLVSGRSERRDPKPLSR